MAVEIVSLGTELVAGLSLDTNSQWLSLELSRLGVSVDRHRTLGDEHADILAGLRDAVARSELVVVTGGLGPTADDLTRHVLAELAGEPLVLHQPSLDRIAEMFRSRGYAMPESNHIQALFPASAEVIDNPTGTAPGSWQRIGACVVVSLPGVPREMKVMFADSVAPRVKRQFGGGRAIAVRTVHCYGAGESAIEERLGDMIRRGRQPEVGITAKESTISLRLRSFADTPENAAAALEPDLRTIHDQLGELVFGTDEQTLQQVVVSALTAERLTLGTAESCTGGLVGHWVTEVPGSSTVYRGGTVVYSNDLKVRYAGVSQATLDAHGAVSEQCAREMAAGTLAAIGCDLSLAVTGIAGPAGGTPDKPVGLVYIALGHPDGVEVHRHHLHGDRLGIRLRAAKAALNHLRLWLLRRGRHERSAEA